MSLDVRTMNGTYLQSCLILGIAHTVKPYTSLNEKFSIHSADTIPPGIYPTIGYFCIGNGGHQITTGNSGVPLVSQLQHKASDNGLFNHIPFILRPVDSDLSSLERANYALRKEITVGGNVYIAYYLRRINMANISVDQELRSVVNGVPSSIPYVANQTTLNPTPAQLVNNGVNAVAGDYLVCTAKLPISFTADQCNELMSAATILYGSNDYAIISEIGIVSGVDKVITVTPTVGSSFSFNEVIGAQIASHVSSFNVVKYATGGISKVIDVGTNEPLLNISPSL